MFAGVRSGTDYKMMIMNINHQQPSGTVTFGRTTLKTDTYYDDQYPTVFSKDLNYVFFAHRKVYSYQYDLA